jgi:DNA-binding NarL/FixJ family response regulator
MTVRVLIVDDHGVVRFGLRMYLEADAEIEIVGEARDGAEAVKMAQATRPDVVLMDLLMPVMDGLAATAAIRRDLPDTEVIALTSVVENHSVAEAIRAGAVGYLLKDTEAHELRKAIKAAGAGQVQLSAKVARLLLRDTPVAPQPSTALTDRERDVLRLLAKGLSNKEIGAALTIGEETVKTHVTRVLSKLQVTSRTQAALYAVQQGWVPGPEPRRAR